VNRFRASLAANLKRWRGEQGLTQQELAERCELSTNYLATVEIGGKFPSAETLEKLATSLGVKPYQLFLEEGDVEAFDRKELLYRFRERAHDSIDEALRRVERNISEKVVKPKSQESPVKKRARR